MQQEQPKSQISSPEDRFEAARIELEKLSTSDIRLMDKDLVMQFEDMPATIRPDTYTQSEIISEIIKHNSPEDIFLALKRLKERKQKEAGARVKNTMRNLKR